MAKLSAGFLMFRWRGATPEVFIVHPGGPFWAKKDAGAWSIPKGECADDEDALSAARRELKEETGIVPDGDPVPLVDVKQPSGKIVKAWALEGDCDAAAVKSNSFSMEWPPKSGKMQEFPEVDRAAWFSLEVAQIKLLKGQVGFIEQLAAKLQYALKPPPSSQR
jgi:predicted NUDIX family NTP pyrophosphohydrolase